MGIVRAWVSVVVLAIAISTLVVRGQSGDERHVIFPNLGLSAIDEGVLLDETHAPRTPEALRRAATRAVLRDEADSVRAPYLTDRVLLKERGKQIYGTQFNGTEPQPIEDPENVDELRAAAGLVPLEEYRKLFQM